MPSWAMAFVAITEAPTSPATTVLSTRSFVRIASLPCGGRNQATSTIAYAPPVIGHIPGRRQCAGTRGFADFASSVGERPHPQFLFSDLPEPGEPMGLDNQKEDDERTDDHEGEMFDRRGVDSQAEQAGGGAQHH